MADEAPQPQPDPQPPKKCQGCGHMTGQEHEKNCIYRGTVTDANAV